MNKLEQAFADLGQYKVIGSFGASYPANVRRLFAPRDKVHDALLHLLEACSLSLAAAMYGWDDDAVDALFGKKLEAEHIPVQLSLDKSQAGGVHERTILALPWHRQAGNSIAVGQSERHAISHDKLIVIDGLVTVGGSTNLSDSGESKQNNEMTVVLDAVFAAETSATLAYVHDVMLKQMAAKAAATAPPKAG
jgi:phosphatidylserine/phosphatidylglycerophosphate/cardiolipin synthase-like enzyme